MEKRLEIINTARDLFTTYGYKKVSMDEIAKTAGVTKRTIYHYFKDKDTLFQYFVDEERAKIKDALEGIEQADLPFFETVHETLLTILYYRKQSKLLNALQREADLLMSETALKTLKRVEKEMEQYIASRLQKAMDEGKMKPCNIELCSFLLVKLYIAIMLEWDIDKKPLAEEEITDNITQILKTGIFYS